MNFLLPQTREGVVEGVRLVDIHGDRYLDVALRLDDGAVANGRVSLLECPADLAVGERVSARFAMGVMTSVKR